MRAHYNKMETTMSNKFKEIWEIYVESWKVETAKEKRAIFEKCLDTSNQYNDPLINTEGWDELIAYMLEFHQQVPGGHFVTTYFLSHSNKSIARWEMRNEENTVIGEGISYGEYNERGMLTSETGFFETPDA